MEPELTYWLLSIPLITAPFVLYEVLARQDPDGRWGHWVGRAAARVQADPEESDDDQLAADLVVVLRRERLVRDLQRVQHLIATDTWMSATRQIGNRIAYEQLRHDLETLPEPVFPGSAADAATGWSTPALTGPAPAAPGYGSGRGSTVETLDVHLWR